MMQVFAFDLETALIRQGIMAPPIVCGSCADADSEDIMDAEDALWFVKDRLEDGDHLVGANIAFDMACVLEVASRELRDLIFKAYENGQIHDVQIRQALNAIACGHLYQDPKGGSLRDPETGKITNRYSLSVCALLCLGSGIQKKDTWRLKYGSLLGVPLEQWPDEAIAYPKQDARTTYDVFMAQEGFRNLHDEPAQCRAAFALHLTSCWGLRTDPVAVGALADSVRARAAADIAKFQAVGIVRPDGSCDTKVLKKLVSDAYNGSPPKTDGGAVSCSRDTLNESGNELLEAYAEAGESRKLLSTYVSILESGTILPINPRYSVLMDTGRTSSSHPNVQNLPR